MKKLFINDKFILVLIVINAFTIFLSGFDIFTSVFNFIDNLITSLFIIELGVKINEWGYKKYFSSNWNRFDFILIILSIPALLSHIFTFETSVSFLLIFRLLRIFKSFRFFKFIPGIEELIKGVKRALKASLIILIGLAIYVFIIGNFSHFLFKDSAPEYFENPLTSLYTTFKIFTVEGWYEIPEKITDTYSEIQSFLTYFYFIFLLLTGGIFGLSLVNSIFVDAMVSDNNDKLEGKIDELSEKINKLINQHS